MARSAWPSPSKSWSEEIRTRSVVATGTADTGVRTSSASERVESTDSVDFSSVELASRRIMVTVSRSTDVVAAAWCLNSSAADAGDQGPRFPFAS